MRARLCKVNKNLKEEARLELSRDEQCRAHPPRKKSLGERPEPEGSDRDLSGGLGIFKRS